MDLWIILILYVVGMAMVVAEAFLPGIVVGLIGGLAVLVSMGFGFDHHWGLGIGQVVVAVIVVPAAFVYGAKTFALKTTLEGGVSFAKDYSEYVGREGEARTELRPAGMVTIDREKVDVVTGGELIEKGKRVRVVKVEGNRIVVRAV